MVVLAPALALAQNPEPRAYSNAPVGLNFLIAGYFDSKGGLSTDPSLPVTDAKLKVHTGVIAYARSLDLWGKSGKVDVILPYSRLSGTALLAGQQAERNVDGFGGKTLTQESLYFTQGNLSYNFAGGVWAPAFTRAAG